MTPQAPSAGESETPRDIEGLDRISTTEIRTIVNGPDTLTQDALRLAIPARQPRHSSAPQARNNAEYEMARILDQRWFAEYVPQEVEPNVKKILDFGARVDQEREYFFGKRTVVESFRASREAVVKLEGRKAAELIWGVVPGQVWDFHHEKHEGRQEWILTRWNETNMVTPYAILRYVEATLPQGVKAIRKVVTLDGQLQQPAKLPDYLMFGRSKEEADELIGLASATERYYQEIILPLYGSK